METIVNFFQYLYDFFDSGMQSFFIQLVVFLGKHAIMAYIKCKLLILGVGFQIAQSLVADLSVSSLVQDAYNSLDSRTLSLASFFGVPAALKNIVTALVTRFVLSFTGW